MVAGLPQTSHAAESLRLATWSPELTRKGPGVLLRDILARDKQVMATVAVLKAAEADVVLLTGFDHDPSGAALQAYRDLLRAEGLAYPHSTAARPNSGMRSGLDLDGDGRLGEGEDAQGYGRFPGAGGMALLSRVPLGEVRDLGGVLWRDLPGGTPVLPSAEAAKVQRLSSVAHWDVPLMLETGPLHLLTLAASTPVFDGPEDRNGKRGQDELRLWQAYLGGAMGGPPAGPAVVIGRLNVDPLDGEGRREVLRELLRATLVDPHPTGPGGLAEADATHKGPPAEDTADWDGPGNLRVDYILPEARLTVQSAGVLWPVEGKLLGGLELATARRASRHRLVWVDLVPGG